MAVGKDAVVAMDGEESEKSVDIYRDTPVRLLGKIKKFHFLALEKHFVSLKSLKYSFRTKSFYLLCFQHTGMCNVFPFHGSKTLTNIFSYSVGYSNEVGESFRALVHPNIVRASYAVAFGYVLADTADKVRKTNKVCKRFSC